MSVTKQRFKDVAKSLARDKFSDFFTPMTFTKPVDNNDIDPITGLPIGGATPITDAVPAFREDYLARDIDGQNVQIGDFKLLAEVDLFTTVDPRTDGLQVEVDGVKCRIVRAEKDGADAMWAMQVRQL